MDADDGSEFHADSQDVDHKGGHVMLISVLYVNNTYGLIKSTRLEEFIVSGSITKFFRSSGWVTISVDPIRKTNHGHLIERRGIVTC